MLQRGNVINNLRLFLVFSIEGREIFKFIPPIVYSFLPIIYTYINNYIYIWNLKKVYRYGNESFCHRYTVFLMVTLSWNVAWSVMSWTESVFVCFYFLTVFLHTKGHPVMWGWDPSWLLSLLLQLQITLTWFWLFFILRNRVNDDSDRLKKLPCQGGLFISCLLITQGWKFEALAWRCWQQLFLYHPFQCLPMRTINHFLES